MLQLFKIMSKCRNLNISFELHVPAFYSIHRVLGKGVKLMQHCSISLGKICMPLLWFCNIG